jgi:general secretion pathway protein G
MPLPARDRSKRLRAFTLIELLTVIAIIGILAAILLPVVGRVRQAGHQTRCIANLRTLSATLLLATQDNRGVFPAAINEGLPLNERTWMDQLSRNYSLAWRSAAGATGRRNSEIFNCPSTRRRGDGTTFQETNPCYGVNTFLMGEAYSATPTTASASRSLTNVRSPSKVVLIADVGGAGGVLDGDFRLNATNFSGNGFASNYTTFTTGFPAPRHHTDSGGNYGASFFNAGFVDGHVERVASNDRRLSTVTSRREFLGMQ